MQKKARITKNPVSKRKQKLSFLQHCNRMNKCFAYEHDQKQRVPFQAFKWTRQECGELVREIFGNFLKKMGKFKF